MFQVWVKADQRDALRRWAMFNAIGWWEETELLRLEKSGHMICFQFDVEGDALRADLTHNGDSLLLKQEPEELIDDSELTEQQGVRKMSILSKLKFSDIELKSTSTVKDPVERTRKKMIGGIETMKKYVEREIAGEPLVAEDEKKETEEGGRNSGPRLWYQKQGSKYLSVIRYGVRSLELVPGKTTLECGTKLEDVKKVYDQVIDAVKAGELDAQLAEAAKRPDRKK